MKVLKQKKITMFYQPNKLIVQLVFIIGFILLLSACDGTPSGVLSQKHMTEVLIDMHKTDAYLAQKGLNYQKFSLKAPYYNYILKKHGISKAEFDSSLVWYTKNPRQFEEVYDNVIIKLTAFQKEIKKGKYHPVDSLNLAKAKVSIWNKRLKYTLTGDSARTHLDFEIPNQGFMYEDVFVLKFLQRIAPEDSSKNQRIILRINYANGKIDSVYKTAYHDSLLRRYTFRFPAIRKLKIKSISGQLLGSAVYKGKLNATIDSISLYREFNSVFQDSLRKIVQKADPKNYDIVPKPIINNRNIKPSEKIRNGKMLKPQ